MIQVVSKLSELEARTNGIWQIHPAVLPGALLPQALDLTLWAA
jgi:hypothetical protein